MAIIRLIAVSACLAALALASTASASSLKSCGSLSSKIGAIQAQGVSCARAKKVVKAHSSGQANPFGFTCKTVPYQGGATTTCKKTTKTVKYSIAD